MEILISNLLNFFESVLIFCIEKELKDNRLLKLYRISDNNIDLNCPIFYQVRLKEEYLKNIKI
jgi:hypothetical protein